MSITAMEIKQVTFAEAKKGYNTDEVDEFLDRVAADVDTLNRAIAEAAARIRAAEQRADEAENRALAAENKAAAATAAAAAAASGGTAAAAQVAPVAKPAEPVVSTSGVTEDVISKAFINAQRSADALQEEAKKEAAKVYREAEAKSKDIIRDALSEKQRMLGEISRLRESSEKFRTEYLSLLSHFTADANKRLANFKDLVPDTPELQSDDDILAAGDVAVSYDSGELEAVAAEPVPEPLPEPVQAAAVEAVEDFAPVTSTSSGTGNLEVFSPAEDDDELDIEEID